MHRLKQFKRRPTGINLSIAFYLLVMLSMLYPPLCSSKQAEPLQNNDTKENPKNSIAIAYIAQIPDKGFWQNSYSFARHVANELKIKFIAKPANNHIEARRRLSQIIKEHPDINYLIFPSYVHSGGEMLALAEQHGIHSIVINSRFIDKQTHQIGGPREKYQRWLAHVYPNDYQAGRQLAKELIDLHIPNQKISLIGLSGDSRRSPGRYRRAGLSDYCANQENVDLKRNITTNWQKASAQNSVSSLLSFYPQINTIWTAGDRLASGAITALEQAGKMPGKDVLIGSIDWSEHNIENIRNGRLNVAIGGHFLEAGWAVILAHDYFYGKDFKKDVGTVLNIPLTVLYKDNLKKYESIYTQSLWKNINIRKLSKIFTPSLKQYDFSPDYLLKTISSKSSITQNDTQTDIPYDKDNDGVFDINDSCPNTAAQVRVNINGCEIRPIDSNFTIFSSQQHLPEKFSMHKMENHVWEDTLEACTTKKAATCWKFSPKRWKKSREKWFGAGFHPKTPIDFRRFNTSDAKLTFQIKIPANITFKIGITDTKNTKSGIIFEANKSQYGLKRTGEFEQVSIPLKALISEDIDLSSIEYPFFIVSVPPFDSHDEFEISVDHIQWIGASRIKK